MTDEFYSYTTTWAIYLAAKGDYKGANYWLHFLADIVPVGFGIRWQRLRNWLLGQFQKTAPGDMDFLEK
jgi:hypothetical protein